MISFIRFFLLLLPSAALLGASDPIQKLGPVGHWPLKQMIGGVTPDSGSAGNPGIPHGLEWKEGFPFFTGANQWIEIPSHEAYRSDALSIGGWIYSEATYDRKGPQLIGNAFRHSALRLDTLYKDIELRGWNAPVTGLSLFLPQNTVSVKIANQRNALSIPSESELVPPKSWSHVLLTVGDGSAVLYVNGEVVARTDEAAYSFSEMPWILGIEAEVAPVNQWWNKSIEGSLRDIVLFNRVLAPEEVRTLAAMKPDRIPHSPGPVAADAAQAPTLEASFPVETSAVIAALETSELKTRIGALRSIAASGAAEAQTLAAINHLLARSLEEDGAYPLRSDDAYRNALVGTLLKVGRSDARSRELLGQALARPLFERIDLEAPGMEKIRAQAAQGSHFAAYETFLNLPQQETIQAVETGVLKNPGMVNMKGDRIYSPIAHWNGDTFIVALEWVSPEEVAALPSSENWEEAGSEWFARTVLHQIDSEGNHTRHVLEGDDFIYSAYDAKMWGWSLAFDRDGYLHLIGGMHNIVMPERFIPGSFERIGASRNFEDPNFPNILYWVSKKPGDISSFEFVGHRDNPRTIPVFQGLNYMPLVRDRLGHVYTFGRIYVQGVQSFGLYRYDPDTQQWKALGGFAPEMKTQDPVWADHMVMTGDVGSVRSLRLAADDPRSKVLFWDKNTCFYGFSRGMMRFDHNNRLHISVPLRSLATDGLLQSLVLYAYSDDLGETFHRADGTAIEQLPLSGLPGSSQADVIGKGGSSVVYFDAFGIPGIYIPGSNRHYWDIVHGEWATERTPVGGLSNVFLDNRGILTHRSEQGGILWRTAGHGADGKLHRLAKDKFHQGNRSYTANLDWQALYDEGIWTTILPQQKNRNDPISILKLEFSFEETPAPE